ncbi:MAG TPA: hypothetical protein VFZ16_13865 [Hyphomicrobiaceae bacterium]|nr:hypothetical protein [Hyphomicrobiaceae bacterium]
MRIIGGLIAVVLLALAGVANAKQPAPKVSPYPPVQYASAQAALERGLSAFRNGKHQAAISALTSAAAMGDPSARFISEFYLARIYSQNAGPATDHTKAFVLYRKLADENVGVDPGTSQRAPFVAKALIALAGYVRAGIKEIDLAPNPRRAIDYLHHAAVFFGDREAQLELARTYLSDDHSSRDDIRRALHYLSALTEDSYGPAQATLADLFWRGQFVKKDDQRALALITVAVENAPPHERIWIEESYAVVFCAVNQITRAEAGVLVSHWRQTFLRHAASGRTGSFELLPQRQCANGEVVAIGRSPGPAFTAGPPAVTSAGASPPTAVTPPMTVGSLKGSSRPKFKAAGILEAAATK